LATGTGWVYAKKNCDGTESGTVAFTPSNTSARTWRARARRFSGASTTSDPEAGTNAAFSGVSTPDPPTVTPSWGSDDIAVIAGAMESASARTVSSYPTNYATDQIQVGATVQNLASAVRALTGVSSENPGTFTLSGNSTGLAYTLAIRAAAAATGQPAIKRMGGVPFAGGAPPSPVRMW
jgi:hypothetical protein